MKQPGQSIQLDIIVTDFLMLAILLNRSHHSAS
jgi:hypothetical protein